MNAEQRRIYDIEQENKSFKAQRDAEAKQRQAEEQQNQIAETNKKLLGELQTEITSAGLPTDNEIVKEVAKRLWMAGELKEELSIANAVKEVKEAREILFTKNRKAGLPTDVLIAKFPEFEKEIRAKAQKEKSKPLSTGKKKNHSSKRRNVEGNDEITSSEGFFAGLSV